MPAVVGVFKGAGHVCTFFRRPTSSTANRVALPERMPLGTCAIALSAGGGRVPRPRVQGRGVTRGPMHTAAFGDASATHVRIMQCSANCMPCAKHMQRMAPAPRHTCACVPFMQPMHVHTHTHTCNTQQWVNAGMVRSAPACLPLCRCGQGQWRGGWTARLRRPGAGASGPQRGAAGCRSRPPAAPGVGVGGRVAAG